MFHTKPSVNSSQVTCRLPFPAIYLFVHTASTALDLHLELSAQHIPSPCFCSLKYVPPNIYKLTLSLPLDLYSIVNFHEDLSAYTAEKINNFT